MKYVFPAIFTKENNGYSVDFPDLDGCYTCGETLSEAIEMAQDALALILCHYESEDIATPKASDIKDIKSININDFINYISCDTEEYRKKYGSKAVKKTLSIPSWLNAAALKNELNFSQVLQEALIKKLEELSVK